MYNKKEIFKKCSDRGGQGMEALRKAILEQGKGIGDNIVKVDMFLNHRLDTGLIFDMGRELAD